TAASALAQTPAATPQPGQAPRTATPPAAAPRTITPPAAAPAAAPERPRREGQPVNVKVDLILTDQRGGAPAIKRTVTVLAADGYTGSIRTQSQVTQVGPVPLNVDASPTLLADGKVRMAINLQYDWPAPIEAGSARGTVTSTSLHDQLMFILENGKSMIVAQSADPVGDRQVTVEVKATILR
ncbi:MAG TPA: hypothetical protein VKI43_15815, partial [Vicinamibacterales bacterium]|nr:hypothetical protein [Vicinamibacterales bacterium]